MHGEARYCAKDREGRQRAETAVGPGPVQGVLVSRQGLEQHAREPNTLHDVRKVHDDRDGLGCPLVSSERGEIKVYLSGKDGGDNPVESYL